MRFEDFFGERERLHSVAQRLGVPFVDIDRVNVDDDTKCCLPVRLLQEFRCLPLKRAGQIVWVAFGSVEWHDGVDAIAFETGFTVLPVLAVPAEINKVLETLNT